jgi:hypothetical protein
VLEGVVSDDTGGHLTHYPAGTYLRNPEGFRHAPFSKQGCTIFVKLHQFQDADRRRVCIDTNIEPWRSGHGNLEVMSLHSHGSESVALGLIGRLVRFFRSTVILAARKFMLLAVNLSTSTADIQLALGFAAHI